MRIVLMGSLGSGKGTYAQRLKEIWKVPQISTGDLFREEIKKNSLMGKIVEHDVSNGILVPDIIVNRIVKHRLEQDDCKKGFIFDGYPRTLNQAEFLDKITKLDAVVNLDVPDNVLIARLSARIVCRKCGAIYNTLFLKPKKEGVCDKCGGELYQRDDDKPEVIKKRLGDYKENIQKPLIDYYKKKKLLVIVRNDKIDVPPPAIVEKILDAVKKFKDD